MFKLLLFFAALAVVNGRHHFFFRRDYNYIEEFDAFYKFHWDPDVRAWTDAFKACDDEGARLFYPKDDAEWTVVKNLTDSLPAHLNTTVDYIVVGIRDQYGFGEFVSVDGKPIPLPLNDKVGSEPRCVYMETETGVYHVDSCVGSESSPFVCKKVDETPCPTVDLEYVFNKEVKKCYKVNYRVKTWQEAYHTCYLEGAMLAVVESESEANQICDITESQNVYYVGYSRIDNDYFTVTGKRFEKFYRRWYVITDRNSPCGAIWPYDHTLYTKTVQCNKTLPFICEMNANVFV